ncbi:uncharacterized protein LOC382277 [Mus musculus]|uniref:Predicted gene 5169 n=1 Tax=Mus musculus TaxID=10090 RepID=Q5M8P2_MOUSE|nr:uncharacterized protein LOC382277 [Mus musculus]AAH87929.1 Predicted gene, 382277 [Mus musculus]|eukprot:NP_001035759.1 predicted gene 5169 [Mus musculus]
MSIKKLWVIPKDGYLLLLDYDSDEEEEQAHSEVKRPAYGKHENMPPHVEADEDIRDEQDSMLDKSGENVSFSEEWQRFARSVETPMENWNLLSGEQQVRNASELDLMEVQNPVTHDDGNANPEEVVGDTRKKINNKLCEHKCDMDIQKFNEEQEKSVNNYQKEQQALNLSECSQSQTLEAIEDMHEKSMEGLMNMETNNYDMLFDVDGEETL